MRTLISKPSHSFLIVTMPVFVVVPLTIYSGCYIRASINIYPFNANGNRGIAAGLSNIQFWEDGEPLNGRVRAEDEFDALDDDDADDFLD